MKNVRATRATERAGMNHVRTVLEAINQIVQETGASNDFGESTSLTETLDGTVVYDSEAQ